MGTMRAETGRQGWGLGGLESRLHLDFKLLALKAVNKVSIELSHQIPDTLSLVETDWPLDSVETYVPKPLATPFRTLLLWRDRRAPRTRLYYTGQV